MAGEDAPLTSAPGDAARVRHRQGKVVLHRGMPMSNPETTLSLLPGAEMGAFLARHRSVLTGRLLDAGCGNQPFSDWYRPLVQDVVALDATPHPGVHVLGFADQLPFAAASFDSILCTEVLEHVTDAERACRELFRVLRPGGHLVVTVPYLYPTHEAPYDFRRFTHFGVRSLLERHGFEVRALCAKGGPGLLMAHYGVLALQGGLNAAGRKVSSAGPWTQRPRVRRVLAAPLLAWIDRRYDPSRPDPGEVRGAAAVVSLGYMAVAQRPA